jgi:hypothetical protein
MSGHDYTGTYTTGITLTNPNYNPVTVSAGATITNPNGAALDSTLAFDWTIGNFGLIQSTGTAAGIALSAGGVVSNAVAGRITGYDVGVSIAGTGTVINQGAIDATQAYGLGYSYNTATGITPLSGGVIIGGGDITNAASATIINYFEGVAIGSSGTVVNAGSIEATSTTYGFGVLLTSGGFVSNAATGTISGLFGILALGTSAATAINRGVITGSSREGIDLFAGGYLSNAATGTIASGSDAILAVGSVVSTIVNAGLITGGSTSTGADLASGGLLANTGTITSGRYGITTGGTAPSTVTNAGTIAANASAGVFLEQGGSLNNASTGTITGGYDAVFTGGSIASTVTNAGLLAGVDVGGAYLDQGGVLTNAATGTITASIYGVRVTNAAGSVVNAGSVSSTSDFVTRVGTATVNVYQPAGVGLVEGGSVTNALSGAIVGAFGVAITGAVGTVVNDGIINSPHVTAVYTIGNDGTVTNFIPAGVYMNAGGSVTNDAPGTITGEDFGVRMLATTGSVLNAGSISDSRLLAGAGVDLAAGGTVTNTASGNISSKWIGVQIGAPGVNVAGTVLNQGNIFASDGQNGAAVWIHGPAYVSNAASGTIGGGPFGIVLYSNATVINHGTITAIDTNNPINAVAIDEDVPGYSVRLIDSPGAVFTGGVQGGNPASTVTGTLELASGTIVGTIASFNSKYTGFGEVMLDAGATWSFAGTVATSQTIAFAGANASLALANPQAIAGTITGFSISDTIALTGITDVTGVILSPSHLLTISESSGPGFALQFDPAQTFTQTFNYEISDTATNLTLACFVAGTRIHTEQGPIPVEALRAGTCIPAHFGGIATVIWVGHRHIDCRRHPTPRDVWPIRIRANAFASRRPTVDLYLSPDHAIYLNGVLIPIRHLINGTTVRQVPVDAVAYYHVELLRHDVLIAEGLAVESYLDVGDRANFANAGNTVRLFADFAAPPRDARALWDANACAPLVVHGPQLDAARRRLNRRAPISNELRAIMN